MSLYSKWLTFCKYLFNQDYRDYRFVRRLHVFDSEYYLALLKNNAENVGDPGTNETEDLLWLYFQTFREEYDRGIDVSGDWEQLNDPHPLFDTWYYLSKYKSQVGARNPFSHYLRKGWKEGLRPSPMFDADFYRRHGKWDRSQGDPLTHFAHHGSRDKVAPSILFDVEWYHYQTPESELAEKNAVKHYKRFGIFEGKRAHPLFNPVHYLSFDGMPQSAKTDPFLHYLVTGEKKGWSPVKYFDPSYYRNRYMEDEDSTTAFEHYLRFGIDERHELNLKIEKLAKKPTISVIVPVFNPDHRHLNICIRSVVHQSYPYWQLCLVDDCSADESTRDLIRKWVVSDERIVCEFRSDNGGISAATQTGFEISSGEYIGFLDNDDKLSKECLFQFARNISETDGQIFYSDEDLIDEQGESRAVFLKPNYNRALLYSHNFITHFTVVPRELYQKVGGLRSAFDGAQDYDLMLRMAEEVDTMYHIPKVLYHWRALATSTSIAHDQKPYAHNAGKSALQQSLDRNRTDGKVEDKELNYHYRIRFDLREEPEVAVLYHSGVGGQTMEWLKDETDYQNCLFLSPAGFDSETNSGVTPGTASFFQRLIDDCDTEYIALLGNGADRITPNWLKELVSKFKLDANIGITTGRVSYNGSDGPSYTVARLENISVSYYAAFLAAAARHASGLQNLQYINGCEWHICVIRRSLLNALGGFDTDRFPHHLGMLDVCYRAVDRGSNILYTPDAVVTYRGMDQPTENNEAVGIAERERFQKRHRDQLQQFERWYNSQHMVNAGVKREDFHRWLVGSSD